MTLFDIIKDTVTTKDGETYDIGRISWFITTFTILLSSLYMLYAGKFTNLMDLGGALAANVTAHGAALGFKRQTEPN